MDQTGVLQQFSISSDTLGAFLLAINKGYHANPYHNFVHCVHVLHGCFMLLRGGSAGAHSAPLTPVETLCLLVSALGHDIDHPGTNNAHQVSTGAALALRYNDISVLENHHAATTFAILSSRRSNMLGTLSAPQQKEARAFMISAILLRRLLGVQFLKRFS